MVRHCVAALGVLGLGACTGATLVSNTGDFDTFSSASEGSTGIDMSSTAGSSESDGGATTNPSTSLTTSADDETGTDTGTSVDTGTSETTTEGEETTDEGSSGAVTAEEGTTTTDTGLEQGNEATTDSGVDPFACVDGDLGNDLGDGIAAGSNASGDDVPISCASGGGQEVVYTWTAPAAGTYTFDLSGSDYDTALAIVQPDCSGAELACNDDAIGVASELTVDLGGGEEVLVVIDGYDGATGNWVLDVNPALDLSCTDGDLDTATGAGLAAGNIAGASDSLPIGCAGGGGADLIYAWTAPFAGSFTFSLVGSDYDTALAIRSPDCGGAEIACNDDAVGLQSELVVDMAAGQNVVVVVDGFLGATGNFTLAID